MPHDTNGRPLALGDRVSLVGSIERITGGENACNVTVKVDAPEGEYSPSLAINSRSTTWLEAAAETTNQAETTDQAAAPASNEEPPTAA